MDRIFLKQLILVVVILFFFQEASANNFNYKNFTIEDGLPSSQVYNLVQDASGYLWFATDKGLCKYDGYEFTVFDLDDGLPNNVVLHLYQQNNGIIWGTTISGALFYFDPTNAIIKRYKYNTVLKNCLKKRTISSLYIYNQTVYVSFHEALGFLTIDAEGELKDYSEKRGLAYLVNAVSLGDLGTSTFNFKTKDTVFTKNRTNFFDLKKSELEVWATGRAIRKEDQIVFVSKDQIQFKDSDTTWQKKMGNLVTSLGYYKNNQIWVGLHHEGVQIYSLNGELKGSLLKGKSVTDLFIDHAGGMWITTLYSGIFYVQNIDYSKQKLVAEKDHEIRRIIGTLKNEIYLVYVGGLTLKYKDGEVSVFSPRGTHTYSCVMGYNPYFNKTFYFNGRVFYIGNDNKIVNNEKLQEMDIGGGRFKVADDYNRKEFLITVKAGFIRIDEEFKPKIYRVNFRPSDIIRAPNGFYLTSKKGLHHYSEAGDIRSLAEKDSLFSLNTIDINKGSNHYYLGTKGSGLVVFNEDTVFSIKTSNGLYNNNINKLYTQNDSTLWVCSNGGLNRIQFKIDGRYKITGTNQLDGLIYDEVRDVTVFKDSVWVVTGKGVNVFPVSLLDQQHQHQLFLTIKSVTINDSILGSHSNNELKYDQNQINIQYQAISFKKGPLKYRYQLKGLENSWNYTKSRNVRYPSLNPGNYSFVIQVSNGNWDNYIEEQTVLIIIHSPFWNTWWFILVAILLLVFIVLSIFRFRLRIAEREKKITVLRLKAEQRVLRSKLNPHFIFNAMSSLQYLISDNQTKKSSIFLEQLSLLIRRMLEQSDSDYIPIKNEIEFLKGYIELEKLRFEDKFEYNFHIHENCDPSILIPNFILQPIIENAIQHGLKNKEGKGLLNIKLSCNRGLLTVTVEDNGVGYNRTIKSISSKNRRHQSKGLETIMARMSIENNDSGIKGLEIVDLSEIDNRVGTKVVVNIKIRKNESYYN